MACGSFNFRTGDDGSDDLQQFKTKNENEEAYARKCLKGNRGNHLPETNEDKLLSSAGSTEPPSPAPSSRFSKTRRRTSISGPTLESDEMTHIRSWLENQKRSVASYQGHGRNNPLELASASPNFRSQYSPSRSVWENERQNSGNISAGKEILLPGEKVFSKTLGRPVKRRANADMEYFVKSLRELGYNLPLDYLTQMKLEQTYKSSDSFLRSVDSLLNTNLYYSGGKDYRVDMPSSQKKVKEEHSHNIGDVNKNRRGSRSKLEQQKGNILFSDDMRGFSNKKTLDSPSNSDVDALLDSLVPASVLSKDRESSV